MATVEVPQELLWDYGEPPTDPLWRLQRIADWFPAFGRDRKTVAQLYARRDELRIPPEVRTLIEIYEEIWREREAEAAQAAPAKTFSAASGTSIGTKNPAGNR